MQWEDEGLVLCLRPHGEKAKILTLFTKEQGKHAGLFRPLKGDVVEPGLTVDAKWSARLAEHLGQYKCELRQGESKRLIKILPDRLRLSMILSCCGLLEKTLSERLPMPDLYQATSYFFSNITEMHVTDYILWEISFLEKMGFGLDFDSCAVTGVTENLTHVSPKTGRAVSASEARPYLDRLLILPPFLKGDGPPNAEQIKQAFDLTSHFIEKFLFHNHGKTPPDARSRLIELCLSHKIGS